VQHWNIEMRALKIAAAAVAAVIVVVALLAVVGVPSSFLTSVIEERAVRETGYRLAVNGAVKIALWPSLKVTLNDVALEDPQGHDNKNRFTAESVQFDMTTASLWSGRPQITELSIMRPVVNVPLHRERVADANASTKPARSGDHNAYSIGHVSITGGTLVFFNLNDRVERRIEAVNADATIGSDRNITIAGTADGAGEPVKFGIKAAAPPSPSERQNIPAEFAVDAPGLLPAPLSAKAAVRLNGEVVMFNGVSGTLGDGAFNGWASVDIASSKPLVKLDLDFKRLVLPVARSGPGTASQPWSNASIDLSGLNYVDGEAKLSAAELNIGDGRFAQVAIDATLARGVLKARIPSLAAYDGTASGELAVDVSAAEPTYRLAADLVGVRALPLLQSLADFDKLDGKMQAKIGVRSSGPSQRAIMANLGGSAFLVFKDGAIRGLNIAQMIRSLTTSPLSGWQASEALSTDLSQLSASFKIDKGQVVTNDLNLVGPLVRMTGAGTVDLPNKQIGFRVEPKLVLTTEGQGRTSDPVGFGIPVMIEGAWDNPRIYPEVQGMLDNPEAAYAKLREMGKGLFGPNGEGLDALGRLFGGNNQDASGGKGGSGNGQGEQGGALGGIIGNLIQQGLSGFNQGGSDPAHPGQGRSIPPSSPPAQAAPPVQSAPPPDDADEPQDSQAMNQILRQLFNR
jgi:AsmA protein